MALIIAFVVAVAVTPVCGYLATRIGVVDHPGPLKVHDRSVPYFGGVAVFVAFGCAVVTERASVLLPLGLALLIGAIDDIDEPPCAMEARRRGDHRRTRGRGRSRERSSRCDRHDRVRRRVVQRGQPARRPRRARVGRVRGGELGFRVRLRTRRHMVRRCTGAHRSLARVPPVELGSGADLSRRRRELSGRNRARGVACERVGARSTRRGRCRRALVRRRPGCRHDRRDRASRGAPVARCSRAIAATYTISSWTAAGPCRGSPLPASSPRSSFPQAVPRSRICRLRRRRPWPHRSCSPSRASR